MVRALNSWTASVRTPEGICEIVGMPVLGGLEGFWGWIDWIVIDPENVSRGAVIHVEAPDVWFSLRYCQSATKVAGCCPGEAEVGMDIGIVSVVFVKLVRLSGRPMVWWNVPKSVTISASVTLSVLCPKFANVF